MAGGRADGDLGAVTSGAPRRLHGVDATRGLALIGMMAIHVLPDRSPDGGQSVAYLLAHGRSAAAFAVLAGAGLALATRRVRTAPASEWAPTARALTARALAIGAVGLALGYVNSDVAVILPYYAVFFLLSVPVLRLSPGALAGIALAATIVVPVISHAVRPALPSTGSGNPTFTTLVTQPVALLSDLTLTGYYPVLAWSVYLCAGLAAGQLRLRSTAVAAGLLGTGTALAALASLASWLLLNVWGGRAALAASKGVPAASPALDRLLSESQYGTTPPTTWWWLAVDSPHSSTPVDLLHTAGTSLALLGAFLLLARVAGWTLVPLAAAGGMTLTVYSVHVLVLATPWLPADPFLSYEVQIVGALVLATAWRGGRRRRGPLESVIAMLANQARRLSA